MEDEQTPPTPASTAPTATVEHWAREKGMLHEFTQGQHTAARLKRTPKAKPPLVYNPKYGAFAAARNSLQWDPTNWPVMTEAEFDKLVAKAAAHEYH